MRAYDACKAAYVRSRAKDAAVVTRIPDSKRVMRREAHVRSKTRLRK